MLGSNCKEGRRKDERENSTPTWSFVNMDMATSTTVILLRTGQALHLMRRIGWARASKGKSQKRSLSAVETCAKGMVQCGVERQKKDSRTCNPYRGTRSS